jgi:hypothetical protein
MASQCKQPITFGCAAQKAIKELLRIKFGGALTF